MRDQKNMIGCFVSIGGRDIGWTEADNARALTQGELFRAFVWGDLGVANQLKSLMNEAYGTDIDLILFKFYVNPIPYLMEHLREIENYSKKEKAVGIPIIVDENNFFSKSEAERYQFLKHSILQKLDLLAEVVKKKKLDTNMELLKSDVAKVLSEIGNRS